MEVLRDLQSRLLEAFPWITGREELGSFVCKRRALIQVVLILTVGAITLLVFYPSIGGDIKGIDNGSTIALDLDMASMFRNSVQVESHIYTYNGKLVIPPQYILETLSRPELEDLFHRYIENTQYTCRDQIHYGLEKDGGYYICNDMTITPPCMMYSFGTRNDYSFDDKIANVVGCEVHSFDPGDGQQDHQRSERVWFHAIGLGGHTRVMVTKGQGDTWMKWKVYSLDDIRRLLAHRNKALDILKIDTEGMIWETLVDIARPGVIDDVKFLIIESHVSFPPNLPFEEYRSKRDYIEHLVSLTRLYDLGFRIYFFQRWYTCKVVDDLGDYRTGCHDIHFVQTKFL